MENEKQGDVLTEVILEELRELRAQTAALTGRMDEFDSKLAALNRKASRMDKRTDRMDKRTEGLWQKLKRFLKKKAKQPSAGGRFVKRCIAVYRRGWRYIYCLIVRGRGIQPNKIVFISHRGKQYSCNPMYLSEYLTEHYPGQFEIIWAFNNPKKFKYLKEKGITVVKKESKQHLRHLMTAKVIVTNVDFFIYLPKVKGQIALDTWHGGGSYKTCGFANAQNLTTARQRNYFKRLYSKVNLYCSSSKMFTQQTIRESRLFQGEVLEVGMPRNDILVTRDRPGIEEKVRAYFGLDDETKIVLYAPTYRSAAESAEMQQLDIDGMERALTDRFGGKWCCLYRAHHLASGETQQYEETDGTMILPAVDYPDMQELLYAADVLVSDYSSCIWDFSLQYKPVLLYCPDLDKYTDSRNFYLPIENWHFILTRNQEELENCIRGFDEATYRAGIEAHHRELGSCETGHATELVCERIYAACYGGKRNEKPCHRHI